MIIEIIIRSIFPGENLAIDILSSGGYAVAYVHLQVNCSFPYIITRLIVVLLTNFNYLIIGIILLVLLARNAKENRKLHEYPKPISIGVFYLLIVNPILNQVVILSVFIGYLKSIEGVPYFASSEDAKDFFLGDPFTLSNSYIFYLSCLIFVIGIIFLTIGVIKAKSALMDNEDILYFYPEMSKEQINFEKFILNENKIFGKKITEKDTIKKKKIFSRIKHYMRSTLREVIEKENNQVSETEILNAKMEENLDKQPEIIIKEEKLQSDPETKILKEEIKQELVKKPEIAVKEEISQPVPETTVVKTELKPELEKQPELIHEIEISPKKVEIKEPGFLNFKILRKKVSEKPIRIKTIQKETQTQVFKKNCPFCGKKHDDPNVTFCLACGYKF